MATQLFVQTLAECRAVYLPPDLDADRRARFVAKIAAAVRQQCELAKRCPGILRLNGSVDEDGSRLLIPHEPVSPLDTQAAIEKPELDLATLNWLAGALLSTLETAAAAKALHGGIQLGALYLDEGGRPKLGDFGIAPVFEDACGIAGRRWVHCDATLPPEDQRMKLSGAWRLLGEDQSRSHGWIAPYFAHELLEGSMRLNLRADQFALGVLLYLLATGAHPYGASLSDPSLNIYFHLEPSPLEEERRDWAGAFERRRAALAQAADRGILSWADVVTRLLASDPSQRFSDLADASQKLREGTPTAWAQAAATIDAAAKRLEDGEAQAFLDLLQPWTQNAALPSLWRDHLSAWTTRIEAQKEFIAARQARRRQLAAAREALDVVQLDKARAAARAVAEDSGAEPDARAAAEELLRLCDEQEQFIESGADALAAAYLQTAEESLHREELEGAGEVLQALLRDPGTPPTRAARARQLIGEVELAIQRRERQRAELAAAVDEVRAWDLTGARQRLQQLLAEETLGTTVAEHARGQLAGVIEKEQLRTECLGNLDAAQAAWELADLPTVENRLERVPADLADPEVRPRRQRLVEAGKRLRHAVENQQRAQRLLAEGRAVDAVAAAEGAAGLSELPEPLREALLALVERARQAIEEQRQTTLIAARTALDRARQRFEAGDATECRGLLRAGVLAVTELPDDLRREAEELLGGCARLERALDLLKQARTHQAAENFDAAVRSLDQIQPGGLPASIAEQATRLREGVAAARHELVEMQRAQLIRKIEAGRAALAEGRVREVKALLREVKNSPFLTAELTQQAEQLRTGLAARQPTRPWLRPTLIATIVALAIGSGLWLLWPRGGGPARPSYAETVRAFRDKLRGLLPAELSLNVAEEPEVAVVPRATWQSYELLPFPRVSFDARIGVLSADAPAVARWFARQIDALRALERPREIAVQLDPAHDKDLKIVSLTGARVVAADDASITLDVTARARPAGDDTGPGFEFRGELVGRTLKGDDAGRAALTQYVQAQEAERTRQRDQRRQAALASFQQQIDEAAEAERRAGRSPRRYVVRLLPADGAWKLVVQAEGQPDTPLGPITDAQLDNLSLTSEWKELLFPPPPTVATFAEAVDKLATELQAALGDGEVRLTLRPDGKESVTPEATWQGATLLPFGKLTFDAQVGRFPGDTSAIVTWFLQQARGLEALRRPDALTIQLDNDYDTGLQLLRPEEARPTAIDPQSGTLDIVIPARLGKDPRTDASFPLAGQLVAGNLKATDAGRSAFREYLRTLQQHQAAAAADAAPGALGTTPALRVALPEPFAGGTTLDLSLHCGGQFLGTLPTRWNPASLTYVLDLPAARDNVRAGLRSLGDSEPTRQRLRKDWTLVAAALAPPQQEPGATYFSQCELLRIEPTGESLEDVFRLPLRVTLGPKGDADADDCLTLTLYAACADGALTWDAADLKATHDAVLARLHELADSDAFRQRRERQVLSVLADEAKVPIDRLKATRQGDTLTAQWPTGGRRTTWRWDASALCYAARQDVAPPSFDEQLKILAQTPAADVPAAEFVGLLREVTARKAAVYNVGETYRLGPEFASETDDPQELLRKLSQELRTVTSPQWKVDPFPTVFLEFYVGPDEVYGLSWHATTADDDAITAAGDLRVWHVMSTADLRTLADPEGFRARYAGDPAVGERLLGPALGDAKQPLSASTGGSFGLLLAPHDLLWLVRWEQVRWQQPRRVTGLNPDPGACTSLRDILRPIGRGQDNDSAQFRRVGAWCVPTLGGAWYGPPDEARMRFVATSKPDLKLSFRPRGPARVWFAYLEVQIPNVISFDVRDITNAPPNRLGCTFWNRGWDKGTDYVPTLQVSFSLIRTIASP